MKNCKEPNSPQATYSGSFCIIETRRVPSAATTSEDQPGTSVPNAETDRVACRQLRFEIRPLHAVDLADALAEAATEEPDILIDFATLTGAARVALGTDLPALFCTDDDFADAILAAGREAEDQLWRLPLWSGYRKQIDGKVADLTNAPEGGFGGAITAALFLKEFTGSVTNWAHIDVMAWNMATRAGRPEGGEAMGLRAVFDAIRKRYE